MTPEQAIGSALAAVDRLRDYDIGIKRHGRYQAYGSIAVKNLQDAGYEVEHRSAIEHLREVDRRYRAMQMIQRHPVQGDPQAAFVIDQMVRDVLYRRFPTEVHADVLIDVAAEVAERITTAMAEAERV